MAVKRERLPRGARTWGHLAVAAFFLNALPFSLFAYAELTIPSTLAGICNATSPLWGMALSLVALSEDRPTRRRVAGLGIGFLGVLTVLGAWQGFSGLDADGHGDGPAGLAQLPDRLDLRPPHPGRHRPLAPVADRRPAAARPPLQLAVVTPLFTTAAEPLPARCPLLAVARAGRARHGPRRPPPVRPGRRGRPDDRPRWSRTSSRSSPPRRASPLLGESADLDTPVGAAIVLAGAALTQAAAADRAGPTGHRDASAGATQRARRRRRRPAPTAAAPPRPPAARCRPRPRVETVIRMPGGAPIRKRAPGATAQPGVQQPGHRPGLVADGHPHVHPAAPVRRDPALRAARRSARPGAARTPPRRPRASTAPRGHSCDHGALQQPADPAGPQPLPARAPGRR